jgi:hypothetical protein
MFTKPFDMFKARDGKNRIRILPPTFDGYVDFGLEIWVNYSIGADNSAFLSLHNMKGEPDPIYEERQAANQQGNDDYAKSLAPKKKLLCWIIDRKDEDAGPQLWSMPAGVARNINTLSVDDSSNAIIVHEDPETGFDIEFNKEGTGILTRYSGESIARNTSALHDVDETFNAWMGYVEENKLDEILVFYSYEHIALAFGGNAPQDASQDQEDEPQTADDTSDGGDEGNEETKVPWKTDSEEEKEESPAPERASAGARRRFRQRATA